MTFVKIGGRGDLHFDNFFIQIINDRTLQKIFVFDCFRSSLLKPQWVCLTMMRLLDYEAFALL